MTYINPLNIYEKCKENYKLYIDSFQKFSNPEIKNWVESTSKDGHLLWREPFLQLSKSFLPGESIQTLINEGILHPLSESIFNVDLYKHQSDSIRQILENKKNTIVSTGTGSGKSFCFAIPIISECLKLKSKGIEGVKAVFVYPMNALANDQYEDLARRMEGTGLKIASYTGDTFSSDKEALEQFEYITGRKEPYDSEIISREGIKKTRPDILITNYQMLELILTRLEDKELFPLKEKSEGILKFLVLDEIHTYSGRRGADVACLIRRLKWHTGASKDLICIGTSATIQSGEGAEPKQVMATFATNLFGSIFNSDQIIGESYQPIPKRNVQKIKQDIFINKQDLFEFDGSSEKTLLLASQINIDSINEENIYEKMLSNPILDFIENEATDTISIKDLTKKYIKHFFLNVSIEEAETQLWASILVGTAIESEHKKRFKIKIHTFFSQGRGISATIEEKNINLSEKGEVTLKSKNTGKELQAFQIAFCDSCGKEYYVVGQKGEELTTKDLASYEESEEEVPGYLMVGHMDLEKINFPETWLTDSGEIKTDKRSYLPKTCYYHPETSKVTESKTNETQIEVSIINKPFMFCPNCGITYDKRTNENSKLKVYGLVGRSTATDILISTNLENLKEERPKIIGFVDNRQDTAFQSGHLNDRSQRIFFRKLLYGALVENNATADEYFENSNIQPTIKLGDIGDRIIKYAEKNNITLEYSEQTASKYDDESDSQDLQDKLDTFKDILNYYTLLEIGRNTNFTQQNLEDIGLLKVIFGKIRNVANDNDLWGKYPELINLSPNLRHDLLYGILDFMKRRIVVDHKYLSDIN
ncbi:MAG: DEAD/DEAH box helicase, partial [Bacteroidales bacterium]|nr:DEAD/DEAH box helicase [Bacteroidales bacterium]